MRKMVGGAMAVLIAALAWQGGATSAHAATTACTSASMASNAPAPPGAVVTFTAISTGCSTPEFKFFLETAGGAWVAKTGYGAPSSWTLDTTGYVAGVYGVGFWVRQMGSTAAYEEYWIGTFTLSLVVCESATLTYQAPTEPAPAGTVVTFNAAATVCPAPQFRFWLTGPGRDWTLVRDWGGASWTWDTSRWFADGVYQVGVWARQPSSPNAYDTFAITTYYVGPFVLNAGCNAASIYFTPATTTAPGTDVALSGSSNCNNAIFAYWLKPPGGDWVRATSYIQPQPGQVTWTTTGLDDGTYEVGLWSKDSTQPASVPYDTYFIQTYQLAVGRCSAVAIGPQGLTSPPPLMVNFGSGASDCSAPIFQFWVLPPNSSAWRIVQAYGPSNGFTLDTTGLAPGPYRIGVWVRQNNSSVAYDSYAIMTYWVGG
jgi:hypothetical protein